MEVKVTTSPNWDDVAWRLARFDAAALQKEYGKAVRASTKKAPSVVRRSVPQFVPSGYAPVLAPALRFKSKPLLGGVTIVTTAKGKSHPRKVGDIDDGRLRAPSYPNRRARARWKWHTQAVRPGFNRVPIDGLRDEITRAVRKAMQDVADTITGG